MPTRAGLPSNHAQAQTAAGDHALKMQQNIAHGSDSAESASRETKVFFPDRA
jgi:nucleoside-diphosphate kinase